MKKYFYVLWILVISHTFVYGQSYPRLLEKVDRSYAESLIRKALPSVNQSYDSTIANIIGQVNRDSLISFVRILSGEDSVVIGGNKVIIRHRDETGRILAAEYIKQKLSSYYLTVYEQNYFTGRNVYAIREGCIYPEKKYIICAHYDAVDVYCADDNASGAAAVIEAARILSRYTTQYSIVFAFWDEEEIGLIGSDYYASQASINQEQIEGVVNMDMIGWDGNNDGLLDIHSANIANSNLLASILVSTDSLYGLSLSPEVYDPGTGASDHSSFWNYGYGAVLLIEAYYGGDLNPYYHTINDRIDKFNLNYFHKMSQLSIGSLSSLALASRDTFLAFVQPVFGYQSYPVNIEIRGFNTHFVGGTQQVWLSKGNSIISADSFRVLTNNRLNAHFRIPSVCDTGKWSINIECSLDGILTKTDAFSVLRPPAIIAVQPDSIVVTVPLGSTTSKRLTISNQGETELYFRSFGGFSSTNFALKFDGIDDYAEVPDNPELSAIGSAFTIEFWMKINHLPYNTQEVLGKWGAGYTEDDEFGANIYESGTIDIGISGNSGQTINAGVQSEPIQPMTWNHIAMVFNSLISSLKLYVNGSLTDEENTNTIIMDRDTDQPFRIGTYDFLYAPFFEGYLDEIRIWNIARTQTEVTKYMYRQLAGTESGLIGYWNFNEGSGSYLYDKTINSNYGLLYGSPLWVDSDAPIQPGWIFITPDSGVCSPHSSFELDLVFDATQLDPGDYNASIIINSSDPFNPTVTVPIHLIVGSGSDTENETQAPKEFKLFQNNPNPFNPSTIINYQLPIISRVQLKVYDILGNEVAVLVDKEQAPGDYEVEFSVARNSIPRLTSGVYFYQLRADNVVITKKMLLMK